MNPRDRIRLVLFIEKMNANQLYSEKLGLVNASTYRGKRIIKTGGNTHK